MPAPSLLEAATPGMVWVVATADTKGAELAFAASRLRDLGFSPRTVDVSTGRYISTGFDISPQDLFSGQPGPYPWEIANRGQAIAAMSLALRQFLHAEYLAGQVDGLLGMGGSGGTALCSSAFTSLPLGVPKLIVSTLASGDTRGYVGESDLVLIPALADLTGLNEITARVLNTAVGALSGMIRMPPIANTGREKTLLGATMFGVTTTCVTRVREILNDNTHELVVFHATGAGGRTMEKLVEGGMLKGVLDITTTEVADEVVGGVLSAGPARMDAILKARIPYVLSLGALDMVNFGARSTVPLRFHNRQFHEHNAQVTLMRTTPGENRQIAAWIAAKLENAPGQWTLVLPLGGVSALDAPGKPFHNPEALEALVGELEALLTPTDKHSLIRSNFHINDPAFADLLVEEFRILCKPIGA